MDVVFLALKLLAGGLIGFLVLFGVLPALGMVAFGDTPRLKSEETPAEPATPSEDAPEVRE